ncbi:chemotaxis protein MotB [Paenimyroides ummariense]|uniref:Chemotaxis protein MotB n=1 Tax=Paenimyroides ummariense TaxID=913024 RepID=A0A1I4W0V6_9FLAO|nr:OmpA family protein [Paenimyroides ummariense]SFN07218.1 chemotaxis protein MotB [Paenimyroides ummariense]
MRKRILIPVILLGTIGLTSCVSKKRYEGLQANYTKLQDDYKGLGQRFHQSEVDLSSCNSRVKSLEDMLAQERSSNDALKKTLESLQGSLDKSITQGNVNISKLVDEINASNKYIQHLVNTKNKSDSLNVVLTNNLTRSLSREELRDVDVQVLKGVVYISLADNMLYKSGSYEISDRASETLSKVAKIINDYKDYDVLIEGNTDNVPIKRENIRNNWDLSSLRASSVVQALQNQYGVNPKRLTAGGRGEFNPIADNSTDAGRTKNRRTQIIITPKLDEFMDLIDQAPEK